MNDGEWNYELDHRQDTNYDAWGNVTAYRRYQDWGGGSWSWSLLEGRTFSLSDRMVTRAMGASATPSYTPSYDDRGRGTDDGECTYSWDVRDRLTEVTHPSTSESWSFTYDARGRLVTMVEGSQTVRLRWRGWTLRGERIEQSGVSPIERVYRADGIAQGSEHLALVRDARGSVTGLALDGDRVRMYRYGVSALWPHFLGHLRSSLGGAWLQGRDGRCGDHESLAFGAALQPNDLALGEVGGVVAIERRSLGSGTRSSRFDRSARERQRGRRFGDRRKTEPSTSVSVRSPASSRPPGFRAEGPSLRRSKEDGAFDERLGPEPGVLAAAGPLRVPAPPRSYRGERVPDPSAPRPSMNEQRIVFLGPHFSGRYSLMKSVAKTIGSFSDVVEKVLYDDGFQDIRRVIRVAMGERDILLESLSPAIWDYAAYCRRFLPGARLVMVLPLRERGRDEEWIGACDNEQMREIIGVFAELRMALDGPPVRWVMSQCDRPNAVCLIEGLPVDVLSLVRTSSISGEGVGELRKWIVSESPA